ncbi:HD-GYP domain-containing protein [Streptomyces sp. NPDC058665]|uniref:HD-GYP domain-containing protein n=1 Tax=Streptomyces sp. NPDC058665 TaxID=3346586 RepID=UPI003654B4DD
MTAPPAPAGPNALPPRRSLTLLAVHGAALALGGLGLWSTLWRGITEPRNALAFGVLIAVGELVRRGALPGEREPAPLGAAGALAYAMLGQSAGRPVEHGVLQTVAVVVAAVLVGAVPHLARGRGPVLDHVTRRVLTVAFAAVCFQPLVASGELGKRVGEGPYYALLILLLPILTALCDAVLAALMLRARTSHPYGPLLRDELRALIGIGSAVCATGAVMALGVAVAGLWALPVFCVPLLLTQLSFRRYAAVRTTYGQTIASLARATEIAGYTRHGHARRVAELSRAVGRELGLSGAELTVLEYAALMHDIGQLSLVDPVPDGATALLPVTEQRRIALLGGAVVRQTGVPSAVAVVVERQADPYREQPLPARIVRAVNAYDDLAGAGPGSPGGATGPLSALERLRLGTGHDYQPEVVESLARVLSRGGLTPGRAG